ncbi:pentulose/hexulose kinase [Halobacteroides halobius DSM 5150]|uniref:Pentulose/hexulose kinase n=1 Tax=Halobacteroides halobius (strain ATCC 35273 / DSM 5150 / MD-1) TaxID=748449 RepID=L0KC68_HALHC|nr:FGGY-family carbohydrate kinase [Halobacteroides halobius]AGB41678.1 pentulose/hexulose kinase [Halobacteroides halobius DSM 5150]
MGTEKKERQAMINKGDTVLGIEFGSTRIKAVLLDGNNEIIAAGSHNWENSYTDGVWTYSLEEIWAGVQSSYRDMAENVKAKYEVELTRIASIGFSGMMHGYLPFDKDNNLLVPFRTWRNNFTEKASEKLTDLFDYPIPQRWSIAHLYQAILNDEKHVADINYMTTLAGYVHWKLSGEKVLGIGEASGMFPIDIETTSYNERMLEQFSDLIADKNFSWELEDILPTALVAGEDAGTLTEEGAKLLDPSGKLEAGSLMCPPEGDAETGMVATNSIAERTGNVSAGTSVFAMVVLEDNLDEAHPELDLVTTPSGKLVAMAHSNNCASNLDAWINLFKEVTTALGFDVDMTTLYETLFNKALEGDKDCGGLLAYGYLSGEHITGFEEGRPLFARSSDSNFNLANFMRVNLQSSLGAMKMGMDILLKEEGVKLDKMLGHGGLFKTEGVAQRLMAAAVNAPVSVMETAGEGGAWGIALLASYRLNKKDEESLEDFLNEYIFTEQNEKIIEPKSEDVKGFETFMKRYKECLPVERAAVECLK